MFQFYLRVGTQADERRIKFPSGILLAAAALTPLLLPTLLLWSGDIRTSGFVQVHLSQSRPYTVQAGPRETNFSCFFSIQPFRRYRTTWTSSSVKFPTILLLVSKYPLIEFVSLFTVLSVTHLTAVDRLLVSLSNKHHGNLGHFPCLYLSLPALPPFPSLSLHLSLPPSLTLSSPTICLSFFHASTDTVDVVYSRPLTLGQCWNYNYDIMSVLEDCGNEMKTFFPISRYISMLNHSNRNSMETSQQTHTVIHTHSCHTHITNSGETEKYTAKH